MKWIKRMLLVLVVGFVLFYLVNQPQGAADAVRGAAAAGMTGVLHTSVAATLAELAVLTGHDLSGDPDAATLPGPRARLEAGPPEGGLTTGAP